jgi:hypothetical protein
MSKTLLEIIDTNGCRNILGNQKKTGRPKSAPTKVITFRVRLDHEQPVRNAVAKEIKRLKGNA